MRDVCGAGRGLSPCEGHWASQMGLDPELLAHWKRGLVLSPRVMESPWSALVCGAAGGPLSSELSKGVIREIHLVTESLLRAF